jgi:hypothetical protein
MDDAAFGINRIAQSSDGIASLTAYESIGKKLQEQKQELFDYCKEENIKGHNIWAMSHKESLGIQDKFLKFQMLEIWKNRKLLEQAEKQLGDFLDRKKPADELKNPYAESGDENDSESDEKSDEKSDENSDDQDDIDSTY